MAHHDTWSDEDGNGHSMKEVHVKGAPALLKDHLVHLIGDQCSGCQSSDIKVTITVTCPHCDHKTVFTNESKVAAPS